MVKNLPAGIYTSSHLPALVAGLSAWALFAVRFHQWQVEQKIVFACLFASRVDVSETFSANQLWFRILSGLFIWISAEKRQNYETALFSDDYFWDFNPGWSFSLTDSEKYRLSWIEDEKSVKFEARKGPQKTTTLRTEVDDTPNELSKVFSCSNRIINIQVSLSWPLFMLWSALSLHKVVYLIFNDLRWYTQ